MEQKMVKNVNNTEKIFAQRMEKHQDELRWLYMELYGNDAMYAELCEQMHDYYLKRSTELKKRDIKKEKNPDWFKEKEMLGMMLYIDNFAGNLKGVEKKLAYLKECNVNCLHLMPFLDTPKGKSDGGYAVADFRKVRPDLGTMKDLARLTEKCHENGMNVCMDFVMNHTSEEHEWAKRARAGEGEYMSRYFFYDNGDIQARYEVGFDDEMLELLKKAGFFELDMGIEFIDDASFKTYHKTSTKEQIEKSIKNIQKHGLSVRGLFILGSDNQKKGCGKELADFVIKNKIQS